MNLKVYDILSKLIPGGIIYAILFYLFEENLPDFPGILLIIIIYILGVITEIIASISERSLLFPTFGGNPAIKLLEGKRFLQVKLYNINEYNNTFKKAFPDIYNDKKTLFNIIYREVNKNREEFPRITDFLETYVFMRNLLISILITGIIYISFQFSILLFTIFLVASFLVWLRTKQRNFYFCKEVIDSYLVKIRSTN
ncbi:MAG: hypothetical protein ACLFUH_11200 [Bacteroidales bacterium]